jgi:SAM-dependent methyltransferase
MTPTLNKSPSNHLHAQGPASDWVKRWTHLIDARGAVLDIACGQGRHMQWFAEKGHAVTGIDRSTEALSVAKRFGEVILADIENNPWPLINGDEIRQFQAVIVTNYLWRPLFPVIENSVSPGGLLIYETFSHGNETVGKPSRPEFLLQPAELLASFKAMRIIAFEEGFLEDPPRFVQRIAAQRPRPSGANSYASKVYLR